MSWKDNLLPASWRGVAFEVLGEQLQGRRVLVQHGLPYRDGDIVEGLGREARRFSMRAVLWGDNYDTALQQLLAAIEADGEGELVHPVYGSVQAQVETYEVSHAAERPDYAEIGLVFIEAEAAPQFFSRALVATDSDTVLIADSGPDWRRGVWDLLARADTLVATVQQYVGGGWTGLMEQLLGLPGIALRFGQLRSQALGIIAGVADMAGHAGAVFDPLTDLTRTPTEIRAAIQASAGDSTSLITGASIPASTPGGTALPATVTAAGDALLAPAKRGEAPAVALPAGMPADALQAQAWGLLVVVVTEQALATADATAEALNDELATPMLTPDEIEAMLLRARALIEAAVALHRALYGVEPALAVIEPLRNLAALLQGAARRIILAKPPLVERAVPVATTLRLLAFRWYGDHERATELLRLNPQLRTPYLIPAGEVLRGYAA